MKPAIFLPDELGRRIDAIAKAHRMNRSEFFQRAGALYADALERDDATRRIDDAVEFVERRRSASGAVADGVAVSKASARAEIDAGAWEW